MSPFLIAAGLSAASSAISALSERKKDENSAQEAGQSEFAKLMAGMQNLPSAQQNQPGATRLQDMAIQARRNELFNKIDTNGDGKITREEVQAFKDQKLKEAKNALLDLQEAMNGDRKSNGKRKKTPLEELMDAVSSKTQHAHKKHHGGPREAAETDRVNNLFAQLDQNKDGSVSRDEFVNRVQPTQSIGLAAASATAAPASAG